MSAQIGFFWVAMQQRPVGPIATDESLSGGSHIEPCFRLSQALWVMCALSLRVEIRWTSPVCHQPNPAPTLTVK